MPSRFCRSDGPQSENKRKRRDQRKVKVILIVIGSLGTISKDLGKGVEEWEINGRIETIQTAALLRTARILLRVLGRAEDNCCHSDSRERPPA